jgi:hypothetical protein
MKMIVLAVAILIATSTFAQQHAPTVATCQADVAVWYGAEMATEYNNAETAWVRNVIPNRTEAAKLTIKEVIARQNEMTQCMKVDEEKLELYFSAQDFYHGIHCDRVMRFIDRHGLRGEFQKEDAAGKR